MKTCQALVALILAAGVAQANVFNFSATLNGAAEIAPVNTPATGSALFTYDSTLHTLQFSVSFSGLIGNTTAAHIHAGVNAAGVGNNGVATQTPSFVGFPQGVTSGTYTSPTFDLTLASSWNPGYVTANGGTTAGAEAALFSAMNSNRAYLNIHTTTFTGGEIRGYITPVTAVPEPATTVAVGGGLLGAFALVRRVRASRK
jgi:hypothetical protein